MTFEEKFAAQGRKLDEVKVTVDNAQAKVEDAVNNAKIKKQQDLEQLAADIAELDATLDAELDKVDAAVEAKVDKKLDDVDAAMDLAEEKIDGDLAKAKAKFDSLKAPLDKATAESIANTPSSIDKVQEMTAETLAAAKGAVNAADEDVRLVAERRDSKRNALMLRAQMNVENAKAKLAAHKDAVDKAVQEAYIEDLLDYAADCAELANAWALEAEYTLMEASAQVSDFVEKYGTKA